MVTEEGNDECNTDLVWDFLSSVDCVVILGIRSADVTDDESLPIFDGLVRAFL